MSDVQNGCWANVSVMRRASHDGEDAIRVYSYRQMKGVLLTKTEAISVAFQLLAKAGVSVNQLKAEEKSDG